jgi:DNA invertase Pin-like site-specific DNA recombinase
MVRHQQSSTADASGARSDRTQLAKVLRLLREGDTLIVTRLDRLARSTRVTCLPLRRSVRPLLATR